TCQAIVARDDALVRLIRTLPRSAAPRALSRQIRALGAPRRGIKGWLGRPWVAAALAAVLVAAVVAPWLPPPQVPPPNIVETLIQSGVNEHRRILLDLQADPREIPDPTALFQRVSAVTAVELPKVLTGTDELRLVAARPTILADRKTSAATLRYQ